MPGSWQVQRWSGKSRWRGGNRRWQGGGDNWGHDNRWDDRYDDDEDEEMHEEDTEERYRSRSPLNRPQWSSSTRQTPCRLRRIALFGYRKMTRHLFPSKRNQHELFDLVSTRPDRRQVAVHWYSPRGATDNRFTGTSMEDWRSLFRPVCEMSNNATPPDYIVIWVSEKGISYVDDPDCGAVLKDDFHEKTNLIVSGLRRFLEMIPLVLPQTCPIVMSLVPPLSWACEPGVSYHIRELTGALWATAKEKDALFVDVEEVVHRYIATQYGALADGKPKIAVPQGTSSRDLADRQKPVPPCEDKAVTLKTLLEMREHLRRELRQELAEELRQELRQDVKAQMVETSAGTSDDQPSDVTAVQPGEVTVSDVAASSASVPTSKDKSGPCNPVSIPEPTPAEPEPSSDSLESSAGSASLNPIVKEEAATTKVDASVQTSTGATDSQQEAGPPVGDVPWVSGWAPGQPPSPTLSNRPDLPSTAYDGYGLYLQAGVFTAIRAEIARIAST